MPDVDASVFAIVFHFSLDSRSRLSRLELEIRDGEVKVDEIVWVAFRISFRVRTDCINYGTYICFDSTEDGADP
jgi:hypothetical protein